MILTNSWADIWGPVERGNAMALFSCMTFIVSTHIRHLPCGPFAYNQSGACPRSRHFWIPTAHGRLAMELLRLDLVISWNYSFHAHYSGNSTFPGPHQ